VRSAVRLEEPPDLFRHRDGLIGAGQGRGGAAGIGDQRPTRDGSQCSAAVCGARARTASTPAPGRRESAKLVLPRPPRRRIIRVPQDAPSGCLSFEGNIHRLNEPSVTQYVLVTVLLAGPLAPGAGTRALRTPRRHAADWGATGCSGQPPGRPGRHHRRHGRRLVARARLHRTISLFGQSGKVGVLVPVLTGHWEVRPSASYRHPDRHGRPEAEPRGTFSARRR
jgi:hypothetical protein